MAELTWMVSPGRTIQIDLPLVDSLQVGEETWAIFSDGENYAIAEVLDRELPLLAQEPGGIYYLVDEVITGVWAERILFALGWKCTPIP